MAGSTNQQGGGREASDSVDSPGSPGTQSPVPRIVVEPADDRVGENAPPPAARQSPAPREHPRLLERSFLEVPSPPRPTHRRLGSQQIGSSQPSGEPSRSRIPQSLTGTLGLPPLMTGPIHPLRMHPVNLTGSSSMPIANTSGRPLGLRYDGNPYTPQGEAVMEKVDKMLATSRALKPEGETSSKGSRSGATGAIGFLKRLRSPSQLFSKPKPRVPIKPHQIRHITGGLEPLPLPEQTRHVPSVCLRRNELGNLKREKALRVLGETPNLDPLPSMDLDPAATSPDPSFLSPSISTEDDCPFFSRSGTTTTTADIATDTATNTITTADSNATTTTTTTTTTTMVAAAAATETVAETATPSSRAPAGVETRPLRAARLTAAAAAAAAARGDGGGDATAVVGGSGSSRGVTSGAGCAGAGVGAAPKSPTMAARTTSSNSNNSSSTNAGAGMNTSTRAFRRRSRSVPSLDALLAAPTLQGCPRTGDASAGTGASAIAAVTPPPSRWESPRAGGGDRVATKRHPTPALGDLAALERALRERFPGLAGEGSRVVVVEENEEEVEEEEEEEEGEPGGSQPPAGYF
ncbi:hypothetical protein L209DRAFT_792868 [Thermothelomyces heterothallicus CBS 203.75]